MVYQPVHESKGCSDAALTHCIKTKQPDPVGSGLFSI